MAKLKLIPRRKLKADITPPVTSPTDVRPEAGFEKDPQVHAPQIPQAGDGQAAPPEDMKILGPQSALPPEPKAATSDEILSTPLPYVVSAPDAIDKAAALLEKVGEARPDLAQEVAQAAAAVDQLERRAAGESPQPGGQPAAEQKFEINESVSVAMQEGDYTGTVEKDEGNGFYKIHTDQGMSLKHVPGASMTKLNQSKPAAAAAIQPAALAVHSAKYPDGADVVIGDIVTFVAKDPTSDEDIQEEGTVKSVAAGDNGAITVNPVKGRSYKQVIFPEDVQDHRPGVTAALQADWKSKHDTPESEEVMGTFAMISSGIRAKEVGEIERGGGKPEVAKLYGDRKWMDAHFLDFKNMAEMRFKGKHFGYDVYKSLEDNNFHFENEVLGHLGMIDTKPTSGQAPEVQAASGNFDTGSERINKRSAKIWDEARSLEKKGLEEGRPANRRLTNAETEGYYDAKHGREKTTTPWNCTEELGKQCQLDYDKGYERGKAENPGHFSPSSLVEASAFDQIPEIDLGGGYKARRKQTKAEGKDGEPGKEEKFIEVVDADGKSVESYPDAFGDDTVVIIKLLRQILDIKDDGAAAAPKEPKEKKESKGSGESAADKPKGLPNVKEKKERSKEDNDKLEASAKAVEALIVDRREIAAALLRKGHIVASQDSVDEIMLANPKMTLLEAQRAAGVKAIGDKVLDLVAMSQNELLLLKASLPLIKQKVTASLATDGLPPLSLSAASVIVPGTNAKIAVGDLFGSGARRR